MTTTPVPSSRSEETGIAASEAEIIVPGFSWDEGDLLMRFVAKPDKNHPGEILELWEPCLPFNVVPLRALREGADIKIIDVRVTFPSGRSKNVSIPAGIVKASRPAQELGEDLDITHKEAVALAEFVEVIVNEAKGCVVPEVQVLTSAEWSGDELHVPGRLEVSPRKAYAELAKYGGTAGSENAARQAWHDVVQLATYPGNEKLLLILGMPLGSIYAARLRRAPYSQRHLGTFAIHLTGESTHGKTQTATSAMYTVGDATEKSTRANLYRTWDMSAQAPVALAHQLGALPLYLDEAATSQREPDEFTQALFALAQGSERQRATTTGDLDEVERWECCILSTGEMRLSAKSGLTGIRRRVHELSAPFAERSHADQIADRAAEYHGWPLQWLAEKPDVETAAKLLADLVPNAVESAQVPWARDAMWHLAVCGLGALMLSRYLDGDDATITTAVVRSVEKVAQEIAQQALAEGVDVGERLHRAVWMAAAKRPSAFTPAELAPGGGSRREGVLFKDGTIGVMDEATLRAIAEEARLPDHQAALELLAERDKVEKDVHGYKVLKRFIADGANSKSRVRVYVFAPLEDDGDA